MSNPQREIEHEPVIGHLKEDHRMGRNYLTGRDGDRINAVLAAAGYNFSLLLRRFEELLRVLSLILWRALLATPLHLTRCRKTFFTADSLMENRHDKVKRVLINALIASPLCCSKKLQLMRLKTRQIVLSKKLPLKNVEGITFFPLVLRNCLLSGE